MKVTDYNYEWCVACDGDGSTDGKVCEKCGGNGYIAISKEQAEKDAAAAVTIQATLDEIAERIASDTKLRKAKLCN